MSHCQDDQSCSIHGSNGMGKGSSCGSNSCCKDSSCSCSCNCCQKSSSSSSCDDYSQKMLDLADMAWMEVLKEKMKEYIRANDHKIEEIAKTVCEINYQKWQGKMAAKKMKMEYEQKLKNLFCNKQ